MEEEGEIDDPAEPVCKFINRGPPFAKALDGEDHWDGGEAKPVEGPEPPPRARSPGDDRRPPPRRRSPSYDRRRRYSRSPSYERRRRYSRSPSYDGDRL